MEQENLESILRTGLRSLDLPEASAPAMARFAAFLVERNRVMNLTAITEESDVAALHFLDSAALLKAADFTEKSVVDVGSGAGFPGIPLRLVEPSIQLTLLDAQRKRVDFLREVSSLLNLPDVVCLHKRAEEYGQALNPGQTNEQQINPEQTNHRQTNPRQTNPRHHDVLEQNSDVPEQNTDNGHGRERFHIAVSRAVASLPVLA